MTDQHRPPVPDAPPPVPDDIGARLEARLHVLEASGPTVRPRHDHDRVPAAERVPPSASDPAAGVADLNAQLELLRSQLEDAFDDVDARIAVAADQAARAGRRADEADSRAQVASARAANVLAAVDALATELDRIIDELPEQQVLRVRGAVDRLRARLQSA
jgi:hypothetical protein